MTNPKRPGGNLGLRHVALYVADLEACCRFYTGLLGMELEWQPDADNIYLHGNGDNLALHRATTALAESGQRLDHIGFILRTAADVDSWYAWLRDAGATLHSEPKTHRDGARSFYCADPAGNVVQMIYHPPISDQQL